MRIKEKIWWRLFFLEEERKTYLSVGAESIDHAMQFELISRLGYPIYSSTIIDYSIFDVESRHLMKP